MNDRTKIVLMLVSIIAMVITHHRYVNLISHLLHARYNGWFEFTLIAGMLVFQYLFLGRQSSSLRLEYYFRLLMISLIGSVMLWPLFLLNHIFACGDVINVGYFLAVVIIMFFMHKQTVKKLQLPFLLSYSYVVYRFIFLLFIL